MRPYPTLMMDMTFASIVKALEDATDRTYRNMQWSQTRRPLRWLTCTRRVADRPTIHPASDRRALQNTGITDSREDACWSEPNTRGSDGTPPPCVGAHRAGIRAC